MFKRTRLLMSMSTLLFTGIATTTLAADEPPTARTDMQQKLDAAHERLEQAAREVAELSTRLVGDRETRFWARNPNRAMLGIGIGDDGEDKGNSDGAKVLSVSPGGPAAGAGLKAGDVITELNGTSLKADKEHSANEKLLSAMAKLAPGDEVNLSYRRDGKVAAVKLKAEQLPRTARIPLHIERRIIRGDRPRFDQRGFDEEREIEILHGPGPLHMGPFGAVELVPLSPKLGYYFGTEKGLLIVRAPQDKELKLEDGDVLIDIEGRVPSNPGHAFRILGSYQPGEKVTLNVLRQRKKMAIAITVPEHEQRGPRPPMPPRAPRP